MIEIVLGLQAVVVTVLLAITVLQVRRLKKEHEKFQELMRDRLARLDSLSRRF